MTSASLARVARGRLCSGCGACAAVAPARVAMTLSADGYNRPEERGPLTPEEDRRIADVCPGLGLTLDPDAREKHHLWGPLIAARTGYATDPALRHHASSGGALSGILRYLLGSGTVDFVLQNRAAPEEPLANVTVATRTAAEIFDAAGSRYAASSPLADIGTHLASGGRFAFVGKPCDVAALRRMALSDPRIDASIPYMVSFFCAGVPSLEGAAEIVRKLGLAREDVTAFRYRGDGWPGRAAATLRDGSQRTMSYRESWGEILAEHVQFRCRICPDGTGAFADVVCADAWRCDDSGYPLFDEADGSSLIVTRTEKGERLMAQVLARGYVAAEPISVAEIAAMQPGQVGRKRSVLSRVLALRMLGQPRPRYRGFHLRRAAREAGVLRNARWFLATCKSVLKNRWIDPLSGTGEG